MPSFSVKQQRGYVLMITLLMFMGIGGAVLASFTKEARRDLEERKYQHNQRVLAEAKQALLMYAYNYPEIAATFNGTIRGPGRLPCPDMSNNGAPGPPFGVAAPDCEDAGVAMVGRFPWNANGMESRPLEDASGEALWYVVSSNFANTDLDIVNSDTPGTITLFDSAGQMLYDGGANGIVAVIIAPGVRLRRDNDGDGTYEANQVRNTAIEQTDPTNYLDTY